MMMTMLVVVAMMVMMVMVVVVVAVIYGLIWFDLIHGDAMHNILW